MSSTPHFNDTVTAVPVGPDPIRPGDGHEAQRSDELSFVELANLLLRHRGLIVGLAIATSIAIAVVVLASDRRYTAVGSLIASGRGASAPSAVASLAVQFGVGLASDPGQSPTFYSDLATSREILDEIADKPYTSRSGGGRKITLAQAFRIEEKNPAIRRELVLDHLMEVVDAFVNQRTGVVRISARTKDPAISYEIVSNILDEVNRFNVERRRTQASQERQFAEQRLAETRVQVASAEAALQSFLQRNREYRNAPQLSFEADRLTRELTLRQGLYTTLLQSYEQARLEEVRNTPVVSIVERPREPVRPDPRGLVKKALLGLILGGVLGIVLAFLRDYARRLRTEEPEQWRTFAASWQRAKSDLRHPIRALRGRSRTRS